MVDYNVFMVLLEMEQLSKLQCLYLLINKLTSIPSKPGQLTNLQIYR